MDAIVPHPVFHVTYEQKDISTDITPYITQVVYTDYLSGQSDEIELELEDTDGRWIDAWYPGKTDRLSLRIGYDLSPLLACGLFEIDEIEFSSPPDTIHIRALATGPKTAVRTRGSHAYENTTLAAIAGKVAARNKLKLIGAIRDIKIDRVTQLQEHDVEFLVRVGREYGYAFKIVADQLVFTELATIFESEPVTTLKKQDVLDIRLTDKIKTVYKKATSKYYNTKKKQLVVYEVNQNNEIAVAGKTGSSSSADTLKIASRAPNKATARTKAQSALDKSNYGQTEGAITFIGNPKLVAGNSFDLLEYGKLSGKYVIQMARHQLSRMSGYTTEVEVKRSGSDKATLARKPAAKRAKKKSKGKLTVYTVDKNGNIVAK